jgi:hypothetical protein
LSCRPFAVPLRLRLQLRTVKELMEGKEIERPSTVAATDETFKKAPESKKKQGEQPALELSANAPPSCPQIVGIQPAADATALPLDPQRTDSSRALIFGRALLSRRLPSTQSRVAAQAALRESTLN